MSRISRLLKALRRDSGATLPEYALGVSLVGLAIIGAVQFTSDRGEQRLSSSDARIGTPADAGAYSVGTTTTFVSGTTTTAAPGGVGLVIAQITPVPPPSQGSPNSKWIANVTITVTDASAVPVTGVVVTGTWDISGGGSANNGTCTTGSTGTCTVQRPDINDNTQTATFTVATMTKVGYSYTAPTPPHSGTASCLTVPGIC